MIKAIIFDCFGVLYSDPGLDLILPRVGESTDEYYRLSRAFDLGEITKGAYFQELAKLASLENQAVVSQFEDVSGVNCELVELIRTLKPHYQLGMLSNISTDFLQQFLDNNNLRDSFDVVLTSQEAGVMKPDPRIFQLTLERLQVQPSEAVFIDDREDNVRGGETAGITSILYNNNAHLKAELVKLNLNGL